MPPKRLSEAQRADIAASKRAESMAAADLSRRRSRHQSIKFQDGQHTPSLGEKIALRFTGASTDYAAPLVGFYCLFLWVCVIIVFSFGLVEISPPGQYDFLPHHTTIQTERDMRQNAQDRTDRLTDTPVKSMSENSDAATTAFFFYSNKDCDHEKDSGYCHTQSPNVDVLTPEYISAVCKIEGFIFHHPRYQKFCNRGGLDADMDPASLPPQTAPMYYPGTLCQVQFASLSTFFYGEGPAFLQHNYTCPLLTNEVVEGKKQAMYDMIANGPRAQRQLYGLFVDTKFLDKVRAGADLSTLHTAHSRTIVALGGPLEGYISQQDDQDKQRLKYVAEGTGVMHEVELDLWDHFGMVAPTPFRTPLMHPANSPDHKLQFRW